MSSPPPASDLSTRVALITGATRGIGRAIAARFHTLGASVAANARGAERAEAAARAIGEDVLAVPGDVTSASDVASMMGAVIARFGRVDVLVNNAAVAYSTPLDAIAEDEWRHTLDVNLTGPFLCVRAVIEPMRARKFGRIINIASLAGRSVSVVAGAHYTASKAGLIGFTRAAARELGPHGITVNAICPGLIDTELLRDNTTRERRDALAAALPARRLGTADEIARLACYLASDDAGFITGAALDINGGSLMI
ncbi:MAG: SDR family NAD(P)-dependent oxidoreductase [Gemmatimonadaceae bacterium]